MSSPPVAAAQAPKHAAAAHDSNARAPHTPPPHDAPSRVTLGRPIVSRAAWTAVEALEATDEWQYCLTQGDVVELIRAARRAARAVVSAGKDVTSLTLTDFPLPTLGPRLVAIADSVVRTGRGFYLLRGFPVDSLSRTELVAAWYGVGLHWGTPVSQNARGHVVGHVKRVDGAAERGADDRVYRTAHAQPWHVDDADLVGLLCVRPAAGGGGRSRWASSLSVYNRLLATRPDVIATLQKPFPFDRRGEVAPGQQPYVEVPILTVHDGALTFFFNDLHVRSSQRHPGAPRLTPEQEDALRAVVDAASDPSLHLEWDLQRGDVQLIWNWSQLHTRTAYVDAHEFNERRHLLRLWLTAHGTQHPLPPTFPRDAHKGIQAGDGVLKAPLDAE